MSLSEDSTPVSTNVSAEAKPTIQWLTGLPTVAVPVYQRVYRWNQETCRQLLEDIRRVAGQGPTRTHFIGSILLNRDGDEWLLVDGQQRVTTIMLLVAALRYHATASGDAAAASMLSILRNGSDRVRLRTHERHQGVVEALLTGTSADQESAFEQNYQYLLAETATDWRDVWRGLQRLEHVSIELGGNSNAQQVFESLNATGQRLSNNELIHNYVHMGRTHSEQVAFENDVWLRLEEAAGPDLGSFWRDYLILSASAAPDMSDEFGVYREFRRRFPDPQALPAVQTDEWLELAGYYAHITGRVVVEGPAGREVGWLRAFSGVARPLTLGMYRDWRRGVIDERQLVRLLELFQTMLIRRANVQLDTTTGMIGTLCRALNDGDEIDERLVRATPEDPQVRLALRHGRLRHPGYVLGRLQSADGVGDLEVEHIHPQTPMKSWTGDGVRSWDSLPVSEQAEMRALLDTIGNLTLLEKTLNIQASNRNFLDKHRFYSQSAVPETRALTEQKAWGGAEIARRREQMTELFLRRWPRERDIPMDSLGECVRVVDLSISPGGDPVIFESALYGDELLGSVRNIKDLVLAVTNRFISEGRDLSDGNGLRYLVRDEKVARSRYLRLDDGRWLYVGLAPRFLLSHLAHTLMSVGAEDLVRVRLKPADAPVTDDSHSDAVRAE